MTLPPQDLRSSVILAVDDEPANLDLLRQILGRDGYEHLHLVRDPREAVPTFENVQPDLVLLDIQMPHLDGFAVMDGISEIVADITFVPVVVLTADRTPRTRRRALEAGATDFLTKPLDTGEVALRVRNHLHTRVLHRRLEQDKRTLETRVEERTRQLRQANEALVAADRVKSDFLAMASHEMRTPLTIIRGFNEILLRRGEHIDDDDRVEYLTTMSLSVGRLEHLVNDLLLAARIEDADTSQGVVKIRSTGFDLADLLRRTLDHSALDPDHAELHCPPGPQVNADADLLAQIVDNLLSNAHKYGTPPVEVHAKTGHHTLEIVVRDHGRGVPEAFVPELFERFTQASVGDRRTATGTGLGLWVARGLARLHGGDLTYEPASPGARFRVQIEEFPVDHTPGADGGTGVERAGRTDAAQS